MMATTCQGIASRNDMIQSIKSCFSWDSFLGARKALPEASMIAWPELGHMTLADLDKRAGTILHYIPISESLQSQLRLGSVDLRPRH